MIIAFKRMDFSTWLLQEMERREWGHADLARAAGMSPGGITNIINKVRKPTAETCAKIAKALKLPPETVLQAAGMLPRRGARSAVIESMVHLLEQLEPAEQERVLRMIEAYVDGAAHPRQTPPRTDESPA